MNNNQFTLDDIKQVVEETIDSSLDKRKRIDDETHYQHHIAFAQYIEEKRIRKQRIETVITQVSGWGAVGVILWVGQVIAKKLGIVF